MHLPAVVMPVAAVAGGMVAPSAHMAVRPLCTDAVFPIKAAAAAHTVANGTAGIPASPPGFPADSRYTGHARRQHHDRRQHNSQRFPSHRNDSFQFRLVFGLSSAYALQFNPSAAARTSETAARRLGPGRAAPLSGTPGRAGQFPAPPPSAPRPAPGGAGQSALSPKNASSGG